jgi:hypothetical protein
VGYDTGAILKYKKRPYAFNLTYNISSTEANAYNNDMTTLTSNALYFKDWGTVAGSFSRTDSESSFNNFSTEYDSTEYEFENQLRFFEKKAYLTSNLNWIIFNQESTTDEFEDDRFTWNERLNFELPWRFNVELYYSHFDENSKRHLKGDGTTTLDSKTDISGFTVTHKLYHSLVTTYNFNKLSLDTTTGDSSGTVHSFSSSYTKKIPRGLLLAGVYVSNTVSDTTGAPTILNEVHTAQLFGEFDLNLTNASKS